MPRLASLNWLRGMEPPRPVWQTWSRTERRCAPRRDGNPMSDYLTIQTAAERFGVSTKTIRRRIADGTIPAVRIGPQIIRIPAASLDGLGRPLSAVR
jgi:excisionase family DNA binding protein